MSRGALIFPMEAEISILDTSATALATATATTLDPDVFGVPVALSAGGDTRSYSQTVRLPCQVETERDEQRLINMDHNGDDEINRVVLVFHFQDLEDNLLVSDKGRSRIKKGDRLRAIYDQDGMEIDDYGSMDMYVVSAAPSSAGLTSGKRNLLIVTCQRRKTGQ